MGVIHTVVKKGAGGGGPGESDATISVGTENHDDDWSGVLAAQELGQQDEEGPDFTGNLTEAVGENAEAMTAQDDTGSAQQSLGSQAHSTNTILATLDVDDVGQEEARMEAESEIFAREQAGTLSRLDIAGTPNDATWQNPTNAQTDNGVGAEITRTGQVGAATGFSDELRLEAYTPGSTPPDWVFDRANLLIKHRWTTLNPGLDLTSTCNYQIIARYTDGTEDVLKTLTQASADQGAYLVETYVITNRIITEGKTLDRVMFRAVAAIAIAQTGTTKTWNVDAARLEYVYTRSGIA